MHDQGTALLLLFPSGDEPRLVPAGPGAQGGHSHLTLCVASVVLRAAGGPAPTGLAAVCERDVVSQAPTQPSSVYLGVTICSAPALDKPGRFWDARRRETQPLPWKSPPSNHKQRWLNARHSSPRGMQAAGGRGSLLGPAAEPLGDQGFRAPCLAGISALVKRGHLLGHRPLLRGGSRGSPVLTAVFLLRKDLPLCTWRPSTGRPGWQRCCWNGARIRTPPGR